MKKKLISLVVAVVMLFSMLCPAAYADNETESFDTCSHDWVTPTRSGYSVSVPGTDYSISVKTEQCSKCKWYKHVATLIFAEFTYYSPLNVDVYGLVPTELTTYWLNVWYNTFGKNATATKFTPGGGSTDGSGVGRRPAGYADDNGTPSISSEGLLYTLAVPCGIHNDAIDLFFTNFGTSVKRIQGSSGSGISGFSSVSFDYTFTAPETGLYYLYSPNGLVLGSYQIYQDNSHWVEYITSSRGFNRYSLSKSFNKGTTVYLALSVKSDRWYGGSPFKYSINSIPVCYEPLGTTNIVNSDNIIINNNTWNGNIYTDNSTNLTYIYPEYTTVNEKNETVTNISNTPIIYNNETKQYYTYDQTTKNYYYITYNTQPTPSSSPTPAPTEKPDGSISTPETGKPGGDTGNTTGILAVLVEIRDNMIQGFLDIKTAFVAGFADLSANFTLAIENLNLNITNIFNKKFPDQSTPETALPSPTPDVSPSPTPSTPETGEPSPSPSPSPTPDPDATPTPAPTGKPDSGDKTNNFWTIIFPKGGGSEDGKKGIFWALVSLILALIAFFANLAVGVGYLFPFLPDGVVMTINTCLIVIFLFTIIKFIMRSK